MSAIQDILTERKRQDAMWGQQDHGLLLWNTILAEEFGEFARHVYEAQYAEDEEVAEALHDARVEIVQVAAVAVAIIESMDRRSGGWGS